MGRSNLQYRRRKAPTSKSSEHQPRNGMSGKNIPNYRGSSNFSHQRVKMLPSNAYRYENHVGETERSVALEWKDALMFTTPR